MTNNLNYLLVTADDFGMSRGINDGIIKAHTKGVVTNTSVMIDEVEASGAAKLYKFPNLSVGLHFNISNREIRTDVIKNCKIKPRELLFIENDFYRQVGKFEKITGRRPDYLDSHYHVHMNMAVKPIFEKYSKDNKTPVREFGKVFFNEEFFGKNQLGKVDNGKISVESFIEILSGIGHGITEIMCHPGIVDEALVNSGSSYLAQREIEVKTLTNKKLKEFIRKKEFNLVSWKDIAYESLLDT